MCKMYKAHARNARSQEWNGMTDLARDGLNILGTRTRTRIIYKQAICKCQELRAPGKQPGRRVHVRKYFFLSVL